MNQYGEALDDAGLGDGFAGDAASSAGASGDVEMPPEESPEVREAAALRLEEIYATEGFMDGSLKKTRPRLFERLLEEADACARKSLSARDQIGAVGRAGLAAQEAQRQQAEQLQAVTSTVLSRLQSQGFDTADMPRDIRDFEAGALMAYCELHDGNHAQVERLLQQGLTMLPASRRAEGQRLLDLYRSADARDKADAGAAVIREVLGSLQQHHKLGRDARRKGR